MGRKIISFLGALVLAGSAVNWTAEPGRAAGPISGGNVGAYPGGNFGLYHNVSPYPPYQSFSNTSPEYFPHIIYPRYDNPGYYGYRSNYNNNRYYYYPYSGYDPYNPGPRSYSGSPSGDIYSFYLPPPLPPATQADATAHFTVKAPAAAEVWFDGKKTKATGPVRTFQSAPLAPGSRYSYEIRARWEENGHEVTQAKKVVFAPGAQVDVEFPVSSSGEGQAEGAKEP